MNILSLMSKVKKKLELNVKRQEKVIKKVAKSQNGLCEEIRNMTTKFDKMDTRIQEVDNILSEQGKSIEFMHDNIKEVKKQVSFTNKGHKQLLKKVETQNKELQDVKDTLNKLEQKSRENNLRLVGLKETHGEIPAELVKGILTDKFNLADVHVEAAHRTGKVKYQRGVQQLRHLIFKLLCRDDKHKILKMKKEVLKNEDYYITDDMTEADLAKKISLRPVIEDAKKKRWSF